mgnify:CR=1 FL=1
MVKPVFSAAFISPRAENAGLRRHILGFKEVLGGALGGMGLSGTVIIGIPVVLAKGGSSTALIFLAAMCAFLLVAAQVNVFARRIASSGSLCDYVNSVFGSGVGAATGWALLLGYAASVPAYLASVPYTLIGMFHGAGGMGEPGMGELVATAIAIAGLASWLGIRNVTLSTRAILVVEVLSLGVLASVIGRHMPAPAVLFAAPPLDAGDVRHGAAGLALAMACFIGFEAASVFGAEAKRPLTMIPRANLATVLVTGAVTVTASGAVIGAFHGLPSGDGGNPFAVLVGGSDLRWSLPAILGAAALSWFGCLLACLNTGGRLLYTLALQGYFWKVAGRVHPRFATPFVAVAGIAVTGTATTVALFLGGADAMDILVGAVSVAATGCLTAYALVSAAAVVERWKCGGSCRRLAHALSGLSVIALMLFAVAGLMLELG